VYKVRLVTQEWSHASQSLKKLAISFFAFTRELGPEMREKLYERFLHDLSAYEFSMNRLQGITDRCHDEAAEYCEMQKNIGVLLGNENAPP
jgi:hypothetical protein